MIGQPSYNLIPNDSPWWYSSRRKKKDQPKNMRENDARPIRVAFQEVFPLNFQEKEHLEWEASFQHGPHITFHETNSEFASEK